MVHFRYKWNIQVTHMYKISYIFKRKSEGVWYLSFQEERLSMSWCGNLHSSMVKSTRLVIWRSVVQIPVQVQIFLLKI